jgi:hypothetical protein
MKISHILPQTPRVSKMDLEFAPPARPGAPSFGRSEGVVTSFDRVRISPEARQTLEFKALEDFSHLEPSSHLESPSHLESHSYLESPSKFELSSKLESSPNLEPSSSLKRPTVEEKIEFFPDPRRENSRHLSKSFS